MLMVFVIPWLDNFRWFFIKIFIFYQFKIYLKSSVVDSWWTYYALHLLIESSDDSVILKLCWSILVILIQFLKPKSRERNNMSKTRVSLGHRGVRYYYFTMQASNFLFWLLARVTTYYNSQGSQSTEGFTECFTKRFLYEIVYTII